MSDQLLERSEEMVVTQPQAGNDIERLSISNEHNGQSRTGERIVYVREPSPSNAWTIAGITGAVLIFILILGVVGSLLVATIRTPTTGTSTSNGSTVNSGSTTTSQNTAVTPSVPIPAYQTYNAQLPATPQGSKVNVTLTIKELLVTIAPNVAYRAWTFNGTVPGPIVRVRQGQTIHFTLVNDGTMPHSIDFHATQTPWNVNYQEVPAGKSFSFDWKANYPGVFMYHCGAPTVIYHIANGMYGQIIVDPANGWGTSAKEYGLVQSEFYTSQQSDGTYSIDPTKLTNDLPDYVVFNGYTNQYKLAPLTAKVGERIRLFILNAGPTEFSAFHVIGAIFSDVYMDGNPANRTVGNQTITIPPGGGAVVELTIPDPGLYPFVTHSFASVGKGALGVIKVTP
jgi:nitrite reductase (NO-forming)